MPQRFPRLAVVALLLSLVCIPACRQASGLTAPDNTLLITYPHSNEPVDAQTVRFDTGFYQATDESSAVFVMFAGPIESPTHAAVVRLLWRPLGGITPISDQATNCSIALIDYTAEPPATFAGAGFAFPSGEPGKDRFAMDLWEIDLLPPGADEQATPFRLAGRVVAERDDAVAQQHAETLLAQIPDAPE